MEARCRLGVGAARGQVDDLLALVHAKERRNVIRFERLGKLVVRGDRVFLEQETAVAGDQAAGGLAKGHILDVEDA